MVWVALTSGGMDPILSCQKAIDYENVIGHKMDAMVVVTAAEGLDAGFLWTWFNNNLIDRFKRVATIHRIYLAGERGEYESLTFSALFYSRPLTYTTKEVRSAPDRHELILGGFA